MSVNWSQACAAQASRPLLQLQEANYGGCIFAVRAFFLFLVCNSRACVGCVVWCGCFVQRLLVVAFFKVRGPEKQVAALGKVLRVGLLRQCVWRVCLGLVSPGQLSVVPIELPPFQCQSHFLPKLHFDLAIVALLLLLLHPVRLPVHLPHFIQAHAAQPPDAVHHAQLGGARA
jgi:hypothetical protein